LKPTLVDLPTSSASASTSGSRMKSAMNISFCYHDILERIYYPVGRPLRWSAAKHSAAFLKPSFLPAIAPGASASRPSCGTWRVNLRRRSLGRRASVGPRKTRNEFRRRAKDADVICATSRIAGTARSTPSNNRTQTGHRSRFQFGALWPKQRRRFNG